MNRYRKMLLPITLICFIFTIYGFIYISLVWFDYYFSNVLIIKPIYVDMFFVFGLFSLIFTFPIYFLIKKRKLQVNNGETRLIIKTLSIVSKTNIVFILINIISLVVWITFIAGPSV